MPAPPAGAGTHPQSAVYWRLSPSLTACRSADRLIFLDVAADRYRALPAALTKDTVAWLEAPARRAPTMCRRTLSELGFDPSEREGKFPEPRRLRMASPIDARPLPASRWSVRDLLSVARAVRRAARDVRSRPLAQVLAQRLMRRPKGALPSPDLMRRLAIFRTHRPLVPVPRVCLRDCLALLNWLGADGAGITLVFGVSAYPFTAHCWLQSGEEQVDDHPESPSRFAPILHFP